MKPRVVFLAVSMVVVAGLVVLVGAPHWSSAIERVNQEFQEANTENVTCNCGLSGKFPVLIAVVGVLALVNLLVDALTIKRVEDEKEDK